MQITNLDIIRVGVNERGDWIFVRLMTDEGLTGIGEASHGGGGLERDAIVSMILREQCLPILRGPDPRAVVPATVALHRFVRGFAAATAVSACEQALWDLAGRAAGLPVHRLLGRPVRERIPLYANVNRGTNDRTPEGFAHSAATAVTEGFKAVKCAPFDGVERQRVRDRDQRKRLRQGLDRVAAIRDAVGDEVDVQVDCHCRLDVPTAVEVAAELRQLGVTWFEEPLPASDIDGLSRLCPQVVDLELIGGEGLFGIAGYWPYLARNIWDVVMPDVKHCGGIASLIAIARIAEARGVAVAPHNPSGPVAMIASAHAAAVMPALQSLEYAWGEVLWRPSLITLCEQIADGEIVLPTEPGLGITLDDATVANHRI